MANGAARQLVLFRHAKSAGPDVADHERPLARRGRRDAPVAGRWLRAAGLVPDRVVCSTARLLIVGHDPAMQELTTALASGRVGDPGALDRVRVKFPTAAIAVLEFTGTWQELRPGQARLTAFVIPRDLRSGTAGR